MLYGNNEKQTKGEETMDSGLGISFNIKSI